MGKYRETKTILWMRLRKAEFSDEATFLMREFIILFLRKRIWCNDFEFFDIIVQQASLLHVFSIESKNLDVLYSFLSNDSLCIVLEWTRVATRTSPFLEKINAGLDSVEVMFSAPIFFSGLILRFGWSARQMDAYSIVFFQSQQLNVIEALPKWQLLKSAEEFGSK